jgi:hypothetical protein
LNLLYWALNLFAEVGNSIPWPTQTTTQLVTALPEDVKWENESVSRFDSLTLVGALLEISVETQEIYALAYSSSFFHSSCL